MIQSLAHTIGSESGLIIRFDRFRKKRNIGGYERIGSISEQEVLERVQLAEELRDRAVTWIMSTAGHLLPEEGR